MTPEWSDLERFISKWFHEPDLEAYRLVMAAARTHFYPQTDPLGIFIQGNSGCGKSALFVRSLLALPRTWLVGDMSRAAFLTAKKGEKGLLDLIADSGILVFKDFTTVLSKNENDRTELIAHMREVMDGYFSKRTGVGAKEWKGKASIFAACTPELENRWAIHRDLGERFITIRINPPHDLKRPGRAAMDQDNHDDEIASTMQSLVKAATLTWNSFSPMTPVPETWATPIVNLGYMVSVLRTNVRRNRRGLVMGRPHPEIATRLTKALAKIGSSYASCFQGATGYDMTTHKAIWRFASGSVPEARLHIMQAMLSHGPMTAYKLSHLTDYPQSSVRTHCQDLVILHVLDTEDESDAAACYTLNPDFAETIRLASGRPPITPAS